MPTETPKLSSLEYWQAFVSLLQQAQQKALAKDPKAVMARASILAQIQLLTEE